MSFDLVGHRGALSELTENTLQSFQLAEQLGVDQLETDVRISADGVLFLLHDATLDRTAAEGQPSLGEVAALTFDQITSVELKGGLRVPSLEEFYAGTTVPVELEIKAIEVLDELKAFFDAHPEAAARTKITSFKVPALQGMAERTPDIPRMVIVSKWADAQAYEGGPLGLVRDSKAGGLAMGFEGVTVEDVQALHAEGIRVHVWPVKDEAAMARAKELGADGGTSDFARDAVVWAERVGLR